MTAETTHPAEEPGTPPVPRFRVSAPVTALAGVCRGNSDNRFPQLDSLVSQEVTEEMERPAVDVPVDPPASPSVPDPAQILQYEQINPGRIRDLPAYHMTHIAAEPHFPARHGAQTPFGWPGAFCLQCAPVVAVAPLRGSRTGVFLTIRSGGEILDSKVNPQTSPCNRLRSFGLVVEVEPESVTPTVCESGSLAFPVLDDVVEVVGDANGDSIGWSLVGIPAVKHDPESPADAGQGQEVAAYGKRPEVVSDAEGVLGRCLPFSIASLVASFGRLEGAIASSLKDCGRDFWMGFTDSVIEFIMGFLLAPGSVLGGPRRVPVVNLSAGFQHGEESVFREIGAQ